MGSRKRSPGGWGGGRKSEGCHLGDNSLPTKAVLLFSTTRQHPNTACLITPSERKTGAAKFTLMSHLRHHVTKSYKYNHRPIPLTPGPGNVMGGGFKAPNLQSQSTETHPFQLILAYLFESDSYCWCQTQCQ